MEKSNARSHGSLACPACRKDDALQHVAAVVSSGQSFGAFAGPTAGISVAGGHVGVFGAYTSMSGVMSSQLAAALSPPVAPPLPKDNGLLLAWGGSIVAAFMLIAALVQLMGAAWSPSPNAMPFRSALMGVVVIIGIGAGVFGLLLFAIARHRKRKERWDAQAFRAGKALNVWGRLYYCARDHVVFDPQGELRVSANRLQTLFQHWVVFGQGKDIFGSE